MAQSNGQTKVDKKTGVRITYPEGKSPVVFIPVGDFPLGNAMAWVNDCKNNFGDIRWAKMWSDHIKAQAYDIFMASYSKESMKEEKEELGLLSPENEEGEKDG